MASSQALVFTLICVLQTVTDATLTAELQEKLPLFLADSMKQFPSWIINNGFDPSPPLSQRYTLTKNQDYVQISCTISNQYIQGFSNASRVSSGGSYVEDDFLWVSLSTNTELIFGGNHITTGGFKQSNVWFSGSGKFQMKLSLPAQTLYYEGIGLSGDGRYIDIGYGQSGYKSSPILRGHRTVFEGIYWDEDGRPTNESDGITDELEFLYYNFLRRDNNQYNPALSLFHSYIVHLFQTTTVSEILSYRTPEEIEDNDSGCGTLSVGVWFYIIALFVVLIVVCGTCLVIGYIVARGCRDGGYRQFETLN